MCHHHDQAWGCFNQSPTDKGPKVFRKKCLVIVSRTPRPDTVNGGFVVTRELFEDPSGKIVRSFECKGPQMNCPRKIRIISKVEFSQYKYCDNCRKCLGGKRDEVEDVWDSDQISDDVMEDEYATDEEDVDPAEQELEREQAGRVGSWVCGPEGAQGAQAGDEHHSEDSAHEFFHGYGPGDVLQSRKPSAHGSNRESEGAARGRGDLQSTSYRPA